MCERVVIDQDLLERPLGPCWSTPPRLRRCPAGHDVEIGGTASTWAVGLRSLVFHCAVCRGVGADGSWIPVDVTRQLTEDEAAGMLALNLVTIPPTVPAGVGQIQLRSSGQLLGRVELSLCPVEQRALLLYIEVDPGYRRHSAGRVLVAAARVRGEGYTWSSAPIDVSPEAMAFWTRINPIGERPVHPCTHQVDAGVVDPAAQPVRW